MVFCAGQKPALRACSGPQLSDDVALRRWDGHGHRGEWVLPAELLARLRLHDAHRAARSAWLPNRARGGDAGHRRAEQPAR